MLAKHEEDKVILERPAKEIKTTLPEENENFKEADIDEAFDECSSRYAISYTREPKPSSIRT